MLLGYIVAFANIPQITPIETNILIGILVPFCTMLFPTLAFSFGSIILPFLSVFLFVFFSSSGLTAIAVVGGTGVYLVAFFIWCFWVSFTRWDKVEGNKTSIILIALIFQTSLIWPTYDTVQNGFTVPNPYMTPSTEASLLEYTADAVQIASALGEGTHLVDIVTGVLAGQTASVTIFADGTSETFIEGGMWMIRGAWLFKGVQNPLAVYTNFIIFVCTLIVILSLTPLLPPFRTMRSAVWRGILPAALRDAATSIRLHSARLEKEKANAENEEREENEDEDESVSEGKRMATRGRCVYHINALFDGTLAKYSVFEPRLLAFKSPEWTVAYLVQLSAATSRCVRIAVGIDLFVNNDDKKEFLQSNTNQYLKSAAALENCAAALQTGNISLLDAVDKDAENEDEDVENNPNDTYDPFGLEKSTTDVLAFSRKWLEAMDSFDKRKIGSFSPGSIDAFKNNLSPWIHFQLSHYKFLFGILGGLFLKSTWKSFFKADFYALVRFTWCLKYTIGLTLLLAMSLYWPAFQQEFVLTNKDDPNRLIYSAQNGGWTMVAYCFATTQTAEGSIKKGILRMLGTVTGAFSAWLALVICEDASFSYSFNTYGLVAWLSITSFIVTFVATERGFAARISLSNDFGYGPIYFVITQVIVVTYAYYYFGPEGRDVITLNRLVANLIGILMAMIMALIPPGNFGGDPGHCKSIVKLHWDTTKEALCQILSCRLNSNGEPLDEDCQEVAKKLLLLREQTLKQSTKMQALAVDFEKDASKLQRMSCYRIDPRLKMEIGKVTRDNYIAAFLPQLAAKLLSDTDRQSIMLSSNSNGRKELEAILAEMENGFDDSYDRVRSLCSFDEQTLSTDAEVDLELFIRTIHWLKGEMQSHHKALKHIKWGLRPKD